MNVLGGVLHVTRSASDVPTLRDCITPTSPLRTMHNESQTATPNAPIAAREARHARTHRWETTPNQNITKVPTIDYLSALERGPTVTPSTAANAAG
jgi:hypothetical protein